MSKSERSVIKQEFDEAYHKNKVKIIPPKTDFFSDVHDRDELVGPYCRVSTMANEQVESYEIQQKEYTKLIAEHPKWTMVDMYADEGISATSMKNRKDFLRLIDDCHAHKVTLVLTKSVTRFARNTVDCITTCRKLKQLTPPVGVFFETENIYTLAQNSEMMLNIYATMAQSESETKSLAIKWGVRKRFENGIPRIIDLYGYKRTKKVLEIDPVTAPVVRLIYEWYLMGVTISGIISILHQNRIPSPHGNEYWSYSTLYYILTNERYIGNVTMQKTYTADIFTHRSLPNRGELPKYMLEDYHPAIVSKQDWMYVQIQLMKYGWNEFLETTKTVVLDDQIKLFAVNIRKPKFL